MINKWKWKWVEHTQHVVVVVAAHRLDVEGVPYVMGVFVVLVADAEV